MSTFKLPQRVNYAASKRFIAETSAESDGEIIVDWSGVHYVEISEAVVLLTMSAKAVARGKSVSWRFGAEKDGQLEDLRFKAELEDARQTAALRKRLEILRSRGEHGKLYAGQFYAAVNALEKETVPKRVRAWIAAELLELRRGLVLGALFRFEVIQRALESGVVIDEDLGAMFRSMYATGEFTGALPLTPVTHPAALEGLLDHLGRQETLSAIFGEHAAADIISRGSLVDILVTELGANIREHAEAKVAWLMVRVTNSHDAAASDPATASMAGIEDPIIEFIVADDGHGLTYGLGDLLSTDTRGPINKHFGPPEQRVLTTPVLIEYAFDRLTSKRALHSIFEPSEAEKTLGTSSGLYWVWNVARAYGGVIALRTADVNAWYDFAGGTQSVQRFDSFRLDGTVIRVLIPARRIHQRPATTAKKPPRDKKPKIELPFAAHLEWLGDVARGVLTADTYTQDERKLYRELNFRLLAAHANTGSDSVLVVDVGGVRDRWQKAFARPLCHVAVELNYTSPIGRSAVVLWNIPERAADVFDAALKEAYDSVTAVRGFRTIVYVMYDSGRAQFYCGSTDLETRLQSLHREGRLTLDELTYGLDAERASGFQTLLRTNDHLFALHNDKVVKSGKAEDILFVTLRAWFPEIKALAWEHGRRWFSTIIDNVPADGGIHLINERGFFQLPSTGRLAREFYHLRRLYADFDRTQRLQALLMQLLSAVEHWTHDEIEYIVSVTRAPLELTESLADAYSAYVNRPVRAVTGTTIDEVAQAARQAVEGGAAIFLTSVINSGSTAQRIQNAIPFVWLGTVACLDTRPDSLVIGEPVVDVAVSVPVRTAAPTGDVFALAARPVPTIAPSDVPPDADVTVIDELNVSPVMQSSHSRPLGEQQLWAFLRHSIDALAIGHFEEAHYHHYIYFIDTSKLLSATGSDASDDFVTKFADWVTESLATRDPNHIVILHPPATDSQGAKLAAAVQRSAGILYRHTVYRDRFGGRWQFSSFIDHGLPSKGGTVIVIDDGANTGETIMGLLNAAVLGEPYEVIVFAGISRLPPHKTFLFRELRSLEACRNVRIKALFTFDIPVFSPRECPTCKTVRAFHRIRPSARLLRFTVSDLLARATAVRAEQRDKEFLFAYDDAIHVAMLREAIERCSYDSQSRATVQYALRGESSDASLFDLAFIICTEPDLIATAVFAPELDPLRARLTLAVRTANERTVLTGAWATVVTLRQLAATKTETEIHENASSLWRSALRRPGNQAALIAQILVAILAEFTADAPDEQKEVASVCLRALADVLGRRENKDLHMLFSELYVAEALEIVEGDASPVLDLFTVSPHPWLFEEARDVASEFFWHASENVKAKVDAIRANAAVIEQRHIVDSALRGLAESVNALYQLRGHLRQLEKEARDVLGDRSNATRFWDRKVDERLSSFTRLLFGIDAAQNASEPDMTTIMELAERLPERWTQLHLVLDPVFNDLFPEVQSVVARAWVATPESQPVQTDRVRQPLPRFFTERTDRAFVPTTLLLRFMGVAINNLYTAAFAGLEPEEMAKARAWLELTTVVNGEWGGEMLRLSILDNGPSIRNGKPAARSESGHHVGLKEIGQLVKPFGGSVDLPYLEDGLTIVNLNIIKKPGVA